MIAQLLDQVGVGNEGFTNRNEIGLVRIDGGLAILPEIAPSKEKGATKGFM
jgi:hypothetical protein